jgi:hypothetical protein
LDLLLALDLLLTLLLPTLFPLARLLDLLLTLLFPTLLALTGSFYLLLTAILLLPTFLALAGSFYLLLTSFLPALLALGAVLLALLLALLAGGLIFLTPLFAPAASALCISQAGCPKQGGDYRKRQTCVFDLHFVSFLSVLTSGERSTPASSANGIPS